MGRRRRRARLSRCTGRTAAFADVLVESVLAELGLGSTTNVRLPRAKTRAGASDSAAARHWQKPLRSRTPKQKAAQTHSLRLLVRATPEWRHTYKD